MNAMILAAGRGERMRPLTDSTPKPLLMAGEHRLIEHHLLHLKQAGFKNIVINIAWLGKQIQETLGDGSRYELNIVYSDEGDSALETGGGIFKALPLLGDQPFLVINGDVWTDYPFERLLGFEPQGVAHLVLTPNPEHHPEGDFYLEHNRLSETGNSRFTFSGIGVYTPAFFQDQTGGAFALAPLIRAAIRQHQVSGELYEGEWRDIGTAERLAEIQSIIRS